MRKSNKKGFTMVELVIVIAVIAILAAVLIPTFVNLIKKANESLDIQIVRHMNLALQSEEVTSGKPATVVDAKQILIANGCDDFTPSDSENVFYWVAADNRVLLWNKAQNKILFPNDLMEKYADYTETSSDWYDLAASADEYIDVTPAKGQTLYAAFVEVLKNAKDGDAIRLPADSTVQFGDNATTFSNYFDGKSLTINLNGSKLVSECPWSTYGFYPLVVSKNNSLTLINGSAYIEMDNSYDGAIRIDDGASLILRDVNVDSNGAAIFPKGNASEIIIDNCKITGGYYAVSTNGLYSNGVRITINNSELSANTCLLVNTQSGIFINDSTITGSEHALVVRCGYASVKNSTLITTKTTHIFDYTDFASGEDGFNNGLWSQGNAVPSATIVAGDYSGISSTTGDYPYKGNVTVYLQNVKLQSADAGKVPHLLMAASDPEKTVELTYDSASIVNVLKLYGEDWYGTNQNAGVTIDNKGTIIVNGSKKSN